MFLEYYIPSKFMGDYLISFSDIEYVSEYAMETSIPFTEHMAEKLSKRSDYEFMQHKFHYVLTLKKVINKQRPLGRIKNLVKHCFGFEKFQKSIATQDLRQLKKILSAVKHNKLVSDKEVFHLLNSKRINKETKNTLVNIVNDCNKIRVKPEKKSFRSDFLKLYS